MDDRPFSWRLATILVFIAGNALFVSFFSVFGEGPVEKWAGTVAYVPAFIGVSFVHVVGGELAPTVLAATTPARAPS